MSTATIARDRAEPRAGRRNDGLRWDIQALRAAAVAGVVVYHLWPGALPGGFVGVDVFFVISGFLITSHLLKHPPARPVDFAQFWARRILRLLPPVMVVIAATTAGFLLFLPSSQWHDLAREASTSMLYVQNWQLISQTTDYLDAHRALSPFQHFWSLSVEEQYYIVWPALVGVLAWMSRFRRRGSASIVVGGFAVATVASFAFSLAQTAAAPDRAYFSTWTRMWELAIGSLLAAVYPLVATRLSTRARLSLLWCGVLGIALAYVAISSGTPFPGYAAALPTLATAAIILAADPEHRWNPRRATRAAPVQFVGDTSYALYLWHWPLIVIAPYALGHALGFAQKALVLSVAILLAWLSTRFLEHPVRTSTYLRAKLGRVFALGLALSASVLLLSVAVTVHVDRRIEQAADDVRTGMNAEASCFGAAAMDPANTCPDINGAKLLTTPEYARADVTAGIRECLNWPPFEASAISCKRGDISAPSARIALFGNSHAGQWTEALDRIGEAHHYGVDTYVMGACFSSVDPQAADCTKIVGDAVQKITQGSYNLVVMATYDDHDTSTVDMYARTIKAFTDAGSRVLVVRDTPAPWDQTNAPADCVARHLADLDACAGTPEDWVTADLLFEAAATSDSSQVSRVDLNNYLCKANSCPSVIGGVIVFSDYNHLSKTFSMSLAPYLEPAVVVALNDAK